MAIPRRHPRSAPMRLAFQDTVCGRSLLAGLGTLRYGIFCFVILFGSGVVACAGQDPAPGFRTRATGNWIPPENQVGADIVGVGDMLTVTVLNAPELGGAYRVAESGEIVFPLLGPMQLKELTAAQVGEMIGSKLVSGRFVNDPQVSVLISGFSGQGISILGEVLRPGQYTAAADRRLFDVIAMAGGLTPGAGDTALIYRKGERGESAIVRIRDVHGEMERTNVQLTPGDTVIVKRAPIVYVLGDVNRPGGFLMEHGKLSVLRAIALAQGPTKTTAMHKVYLIRNATVDGAEEPDHANISELNLGKMARGMRIDLPLEPDDILFVPTSTLRSIVLSSLPGVVTSIGSAAIYSTLN